MDSEIGTIAGARIYFVLQNTPLEYLRHPWSVAKIWEGRLAYFGGLFGALPWGIIYTNPNSYAPTDGLARHPDQFYELLGDLLIAGLLLKLRGRVCDGCLFTLYLALFSVLRFLLFFVLASVEPVALGLNAQWTAIAILAIAIPVSDCAPLSVRRGNAEVIGELPKGGLSWRCAPCEFLDG